MIRRMITALAIVGAVLAVAVPGTTHTNDPRDCMGTITRLPDTDPDSEEDPTILYVDEDGGGIWFYLESNMHPGLQRGGEHPVLGGLDEDNCDSRHANGPGSVADLLLL